ncbi:MAG: restriction endonuclease subunit S, partial [Lachnospiraceae bacterium]|nr:restriction endonuclease subunit S [Lachnospiraceae bacterium]
MGYEVELLGNLVSIRTGKLDSNAAVVDGEYPFFTCDPVTLAINIWAYDTEAVLLAGNNASGNYTAKYYNGKFNAYQRTYIIEALDNERINIRFLTYAMNQQLSLLKVMSAGSTTKFLKIGMLQNLVIPYPSYDKQEKIAGILSAYDNLIENNQKQIKLLEEATQRLYKEWFVDLRFPGYEDCKIVNGVPVGWNTRKVTDFLEIKYGKDHKELEDGDIPVYGSGGIMRKVKSVLYSGESVLIPRKGSLNNIMYVTGVFWTIDTMFFSKPRMGNIV